MPIFDVSRSLSPRVAPWPGDTPFSFDLKWKMSEGATVNVGAINMGVHNGTHADAVFHFEPDGPTIEQMALDVYLGAAVVVDLSEKFRHASGDGSKPEIEIRDLEAIETKLSKAPRVLLKTNVWNNSEVFPGWIPVIAPDVAAWLGARGVRLLGLDLPSVDAIEAKHLRNHHALAAAGISILESLDLREIEAGEYQLAALPLRISGADGAPVRAVLWRS